MHRVHARYAPSSDDAIIERHAPLIERAARRLSARTAGAVAPEDLWSAGAVGLLEAARRFDATRDVAFETFVEHRVHGAMIDELRRLDHLPRRLRNDLDRVERARSKLSQALGREPEASEIADELSVSLDDLHAMQTLALPHLGLEHSATMSAPAPGGEELAMRSQALQAVAGAVERLPERLQVLLSLHYVDGLSYREIARVLDVSEPRVCQLHGEAMKLLRADLGAG